jgi:hypothetical protein
MSDVTKRIYVSLCGGLTIPWCYFLLLIAFDVIFRVRAAQVWRWLFFPLTGFAVAYSSLAHPGLEYVWGVPLDVILFTFIANTVFYAALSFLVLSAFAIWKRRGDLIT